MNESFSQTQLLNQCIDQLREGDEGARERILDIVVERLIHLVRKMKKGFPKVARWEETDDVFQNASMRLYKALAEVDVQDACHFYRLAALHFRRELIDMARRYQGPQGMGRHHQTMAQGNFNNDQDEMPMAFDPGGMTQNPQKVAEWSEFHKEIEKLPQAEKDVFDLIWYHGMGQEEAAGILDVSVRQVKRRWRSAKLLLHEQLGGDIPS